MGRAVRSGAGVAGDVVRTGEEDHGGGFEVDDIGEKPDEHLRSGLAADAAIDVGFAGERFEEFPAVGDGVSVENDAAGLGLEFGVIGVIAAELIPVLELVGEGLGGGRQAAVGAGRGEVLGELSEHGQGGEEGEQFELHPDYATESGEGDADIEPGEEDADADAGGDPGVWRSEEE